MLEGKELEGTFAGGSYSLDVDMLGIVAINLSYAKDLGDAQIQSSSSVSVSLFTILEKLAAKTGTTWDDKAVAVIESALGIKKP